MKITKRPTDMKVISISENESTIRFYFGDAYRDKKYKSKNGKISFLTLLRIYKDFMSGNFKKEDNKNEKK